MVTLWLFHSHAVVLLWFAGAALWSRCGALACPCKSALLPASAIRLPDLHAERIALQASNSTVGLFRIHVAAATAVPAGYGAAHLAMAGYLRDRDSSRPVGAAARLSFRLLHAGGSGASGEPPTLLSIYVAVHEPRAWPAQGLRVHQQCPHPTRPQHTRTPH